MFNQMQCIGHLANEGQLRYLPSGQAIYKNSIATSHKWKDQSGLEKSETMFMDITMFGRSAEVANQWLKKGSKVFLQGRVILEKWTAQDGTNRNRHALRVDTMKMLDSKSDAQNQSMPPHQPQTVQQSSAGQYNNAGTNYTQPPMDEKIPEIDIDEDSIPF